MKYIRLISGESVEALDSPILVLNTNTNTTGIIQADPIKKIISKTGSYSSDFNLDF